MTEVILSYTELVIIRAALLKSVEELPEDMPYINRHRAEENINDLREKIERKMAGL